MARIELIHELQEVPIRQSKSGGINGLLNDIYEDITGHQCNAAECDLSILIYWQNIESLETSGFKILRMAAVKLRNR